MSALWFGLWHGGASYALGSLEEDVETFSSLAEARSALRSREENGYIFRQSFSFADGRSASVFTPCADRSSSLQLWSYDPRDVADPYPCRVLSFGPRGGITEEKF